MDMSEIITKIEKVFDNINAHFYKNELKRPVITVQTGRRGVLGWCSSKERWDNQEDKRYEVNIVAEALCRSKEQIVETLLHECAHLYNAQKGVSDCGATQYHNKKFKEVADNHGLVASKITNYGFAKTELNDEGKEFAKDQDLDIDTSRISASASKIAYNKPVTYACPGCGRKIRFHNYKLNIICGDCQRPFEPIS